MFTGTTTECLLSREVHLQEMSVSGGVTVEKNEEITWERCPLVRGQNAVFV